MRLRELESDCLASIPSGLTRRNVLLAVRIIYNDRMPALDEPC